MLDEFTRFRYQQFVMPKRDFQDTLSHCYAAFVVIVALLIYIKTLAPTVAFFDSGELIAAAYTLGVAHPPGYPLYVLLGWVFAHLPFGSVAYRLNLMSAVFAALAAVMVYYLTYTILTRSYKNRQRRSPFPPAPLKKPNPERMLHPIVAMIAALMFAFSLTHWQHAVIAEVYPLNAFFCGLFVFLLIRWHEHYKLTRYKLLYLAAFVIGIGFGNHQTIALLAVPACFLVLVATPRILFDFKKLAYVLLGVILGLSIYLLLPIRAASNPPINWGNPVTFEQFEWVVLREGYSDVPKGHALKALWLEFMGKPTPDPSQEGKPTPAPAVRQAQDNAQESEVVNSGGNRPVIASEAKQSRRDEEIASSKTPRNDTVVSENVTSLPAQEENRSVFAIIARSLFLKQLFSFNPVTEFGYIGIGLALIGCIYSLCTERRIGVTLLIAVIVMVVVIVIIGDAPEEDIFLVAQFHTPSYLLMAVWIGLGMIPIARLLLWLASFSRNLQYGIVFSVAVIFLIFPIWQMYGNRSTVDRRNNYVAYDYASNILNSLKPNAILFTWGDSGAFPLWYLQIVEGVRPDVTLIHVPHLGTDWYVASLPSDLFIAPDPYQRYRGDLFAILDEIVNKHTFSRPVYFDYSSAHSIRVSVPLMPYGIVYKVRTPGDTFDADVWKQYRLRGILDNTPIALDPDIQRAFIMYGATQMELGEHYLRSVQFEQAEQAFTTAINIAPLLRVAIGQICADFGFRTMEFNQLETAAAAFNLAVRFAPELGDDIARNLEFQEKLIGSRLPNRSTVQPSP